MHRHVHRRPPKHLAVDGAVDVRHFAVADDNPMDFDWDEEMLDSTRIDL